MLHGQYVLSVVIDAKEKMKAKDIICYIYHDWDDIYVFPNLLSFVEWIKKQSWVIHIQNICLKAYVKSPMGESSKSENITTKELLELGVLKENKLDIKAIEKEVDEKIEKSKKEWKSYLDNHFKNGGPAFTGSPPYHETPREILIQNVVNSRKYSWV